MTTAISITDLKKTYVNGFEALKGISLEVQQGDFFALLGPNGAGKSTTIGVILPWLKGLQVVSKFLERMWILMYMTQSLISV